jgi:hypothetical protein
MTEDVLHGDLATRNASGPSSGGWTSPQIAGSVRQENLCRVASRCRTAVDHRPFAR